MLQRLSVIFFIFFHIISMLHADECSCNCRGRRSQSICDSVDDLWKIADTNTGKLMEWERYRPFVERFSERWKKEISDIVERQIEEYMSKRRSLPKPANLISAKENEIEDDSMMIPKSSEDDNDLVSNLLAKVEMVENRTIEVEEELKSERRVRRHLQQEVKETQSSLIFLGDRLNATAPVDAMMDQVQIAIYSSLEDMNKTLYEDHLKKLYYKVDGVAYKNETENLIERLEHVETELRDTDNVSIVFKFAEELKTMKESVYHLNNSVGNTLIPLIETLNNSIESILVPRLETLEIEAIRKDRVDEVEENMKNLLNNTELQLNALVDMWADKNIQRFEEKFQNFSEKWTKSIEILQNQVEYLKNETILEKTIENSKSFDMKINKSENENGTIDDIIYWEPEVVSKVANRSQITDNYDDVVTLDPNLKPDVVGQIRIGEVSGQDYETCEKPVINDTNLLADVVKDSYGRSYLKFGCRPVGLYVVSHLPIPPRCEMGFWKEPFPSCKMLSTLNEIENLAGELMKEHPCSAGSGGYPDPTNCSQFIQCSHGTAMITTCPGDLIYNSKLKVCDYRRRTPCDSTTSEKVKELQNLIPPIHIEPDILDKTNSHMGTGTGGELIVHPRSSFTLHCMYPGNIWGLPTWNVTYTHADTKLRENSGRRLTLKEGENRVSLTITAAQEEDSGIYKCYTSFGVQHAIEVVVKVVTCPAFIMDDEYEDVFYRPTPEGELRIMGTTAEFLCQGGYTLTVQCMADGNWSRGIPSEDECSLKSTTAEFLCQGCYMLTAQCMAAGNWSRDILSEDECLLKKRSTDNTWNCKPFDLSDHPDLILERNDDEKVITFKCAGRKRLIGNAFTRCRDDGFWSHLSLPRCKD